MYKTFSLLNSPQVLSRIALMILVCCFTHPSVFGQKINKNNVFTLEGRIENFGNGILIGTIIDSKNNTINLDTLVVRNDVFKHSSYVNEKQIVRYKTIGDQFAKYRKAIKNGDTVIVDFSEEKSRSIEVVAFPGAKITVYGVAKTYLDAYPGGTEENIKIAVLNRKIYPLLDQLGDLDYSNKKTFNSVLKTEDSLLTSITLFENEFIKDNPSSIIASYIIWERFKALNKRNPAEADSLLSLIRPAENDTYLQHILLLQRNRLKENIEVSIGDTFPEFQTKLVYKGSAFNMKHTRGKYTLIDFWGSWCIPCVKEMPKLKEFYEKYKSKLNIVGVANDKYQNWKAFLDKNKYDWVQVLDQDTLKLSDALHIEVYPTKYLLDSYGKVIMIFRDANDEIWKLLENLLSTKAYHQS